jgi:hypothetical protein
VTTADTNPGDAVISVAAPTTNFPVAATILLNGTAVTCTGKTATTFTGCAGTPPSSIGAAVNTALSPNNTSLIGGFIKIEKQDNAGAWTDVTLEILNLGIASANQASACADPNPSAVVRLERLADQASCATNGSIVPGDYWPQALFDPREAMVRDNVTPAGPLLGGVMYYVAIDAGNLKKWFAGTIGTTGTVAHNSNGAGYSVYFSDRRNNNTALLGAGVETGEYGWEDIVNPLSAAGTPNGVLDTGEDVNGDTVLQVYGQYPQNNVQNGITFSAPLDAAARPWTVVTARQAQSNRAVLFRRALKLVNGNIVAGVNNIPLPGLTVISENPLYIQGDYNASAAGFVAPNAAASVLADSVTLLSTLWTDNNSFANPYNSGARLRPADSYYRVAILGGKNPAFPLPTAFAPGAADFGTDGGAHNFLRMLESNAGGGSTVHYLGSIATFFFSRQGTGLYKSTGNIYGVPTRDFQFDIAFLDPAKLPPLTPVFRDLNTIGFFQELRPGR